MPTNSDVGINLKARTDEFEAKLKRAVGAFESLAIKGNDVSRSVDSSMKKMSIVAKNTVNEIERSFNSLSIKSDMSLSNQTKALALNAKFFERQYQKIATDATTSASEVTRAYTAMNSKIRQLSEQPLKSAFSTLGIMPASAIDAKKATIVSAYNEIKNSGTASAKDIKTAHAAMNRELLRTEGQISKTTKKFDVMSLASVAAIAKIQVLYSLINTGMSLIGSIPATMMSSVEDFNAAAVANAAIVTSLQKSTRDVGARYRENKIYAEAVQEVLIKMDAQTAASGMNLTDMNRKFTEQGILIDINNEKQIQGMLAVANAISAINSGSANLNLQFSQEVSSLLQGNLRPGDKLAKFLDAQLGGELKEQLALWKQLSVEQNNSGLVLEKLLPLLAGFEAAQVDINALWITTKSTLDTIYNEILREGFAPQFEIIVNKSKEFGDVLTENKHKIAEMMQAGFLNANAVLSFIGKYGEDVANVGGLLLAAKTAQVLFNGAVKANPYVLIATGLVAANAGLQEYDMNLGSIVTKFKAFGETVGFLERTGDPFGKRSDEIESLRTQIDGLSESLQAGSTAGKAWYDFVLFPDKAAEKDRITETVAEIKRLQSELDKLTTPTPGVIPATPSAVSVPGEILSGGVSDAEQKNIDKAIKDAARLAEQWDKTRLGLEREINEAGLSSFEVKLEDIKNRAIDLRVEFGDNAAIDMWEKTSIGAAKAAEATKQVALIVKDYADEKKRVIKLTEEYQGVVLSTMSQEEQGMEAIKNSYAEKRQIVNAMVLEGLDAGEAEQLSLRLVNKEAQEVKKAFLDMKEEGKATSEILTDAFSGWANNMSSTFTDVVWGAELSFGSILESFGKMLTQMVIQAMIVKPLLDSITGMMGGGSASSAWINPDTGGAFVASAKGNAFSSISGHSNQIVSSPTLFKHAGVTPFATGGGVMGEAGPEAIMPLTRDASGRLGVSGKGGGSVTNVIINNNASKSEVSATEIKNASGGKDIVIMIEDIVGKSIRSGRGNISKAMRSTFGATPMLAGR